MRSCDTHLDLFLLCNSMTAEYLSLCCAVTLYFLWSEFHKSINGVPVRPSTSQRTLNQHNTVRAALRVAIQDHCIPATLEIHTSPD
jgi:hypothetical protein